MEANYSAGQTQSSYPLWTTNGSQVSTTSQRWWLARICSSVQAIHGHICDICLNQNVPSLHLFVIMQTTVTARKSELQFMSSVEKAFKYLSVMYGSRRGSSKISRHAVLYLTPRCWTDHVLSGAIKNYYFYHFQTLRDQNAGPIIQQHTLYVNEELHILGLEDLLTRSKEPAENSAKEHFNLRRKWFTKQQQQKIRPAGTDFWETGRLLCHYFMYIHRICCYYFNTSLLQADAELAISPAYCSKQ